MIGTRLGHYVIKEQIGAGGMGVVYRARDERLARDVALKVLPLGCLSDEVARKRLRREALALSRRARALLQSVTAEAQVDHHAAYSIGTAYAQLGEFVEARRWLSRAASTGFPCYPWFEQDPLLKPLRGDADSRRFRDELRQTWESAKSRYASSSSHTP